MECLADVIELYLVSHNFAICDQSDVESRKAAVMKLIRQRASYQLLFRIDSPPPTICFVRRILFRVKLSTVCCLNYACRPARLTEIESDEVACCAFVFF